MAQRKKPQQAPSRPAPATSAAAHGAGSPHPVAAEPFLAGPLPVALLIALTLVVFAPLARNGFVRFDDDGHLFNNPQMRQGLGWATARWALTTREFANWYPLTRLTELADVSLFGMRPGAHHLVSAAWHAAAAGTLFAALRLMTGAAGASLAVAAVFALHPLQVESVAWAVERSMVLSGFFFALALLLWVRHARRPGAGRYAALLAATALGTLAKPTLVTLPCVLLLLDLWPLGRLGDPAAPWRPRAAAVRRSLLELAPLLLLAAGLAALTYVIQHRVAMESLTALPARARLANAALSYWRYLGKIVWPARLAVLYPHPGLRYSPAAAAVAALALAATTGLFLSALRRRPWLGVGWLWFVGALVPTIGLVQVGVQGYADRYVYLPLSGLLLAAVWEARSRLPSRTRLLQAGCVAAALAALAAATVAQERLWHDSLKLFRHTLAVTEGNWLIENNLGVDLYQRGMYAEAAEHYGRAVAIKPDYADARNNLAIALRSRKRFDEALAQAREALRLRPAEARYQTELGNVLHDAGRLAEAAEAYREAVRLGPQRVDARFNLGVTLASLRRYDEAAAAYREALRLEPGNRAARSALAALSAGDGPQR